MKITKISTTKLSDSIQEKEYYDKNFMVKKEIIHNGVVSRIERYIRLGMFVLRIYEEEYENSYELFFFGTRKKTSIENYIVRFIDKHNYSIQWFVKDKLIAQDTHTDNFIDKLRIKYDEDMYPTKFSCQSLSTTDKSDRETISGKFNMYYPNAVSFTGESNKTGYSIYGIYNLKHHCQMMKRDIINGTPVTETSVLLNSRGDIQKLRVIDFSNTDIFSNVKDTTVSWEYFD